MRIALPLAALVGLCAPNPARAQSTFTWNGSGTAWNSSGSWNLSSTCPGNANGYPGTGDTALFGVAGATATVNLNTAITVDLVVISSSQTKYTFAAGTGGSLTTTSNSLGTYVNITELTLGSANVLNGNLSMQSTGTFRTGATVGFSETLGRLRTASGATTIALGTGRHDLTFASAELGVSGATLQILGWHGAVGGSGTRGRIMFTDTSSLSVVELNSITFKDLNGIAGNDYFAVLSGNELVPSLIPAPEPASVLGVAAAGLGLAGWVRRRRSARRVATRPRPAT